MSDDDKKESVVDEGIEDVSKDSAELATEDENRDNTVVSVLEESVTENQSSSEGEKRPEEKQDVVDSSGGHLEVEESDIDAPEEVAETQVDPIPDIEESTKGPYSLTQLITDIEFFNPEFPESKNSYPTAIESWEMNIYIGTNVGELLHFYKIEADYILISRQRINDKKIRSIKKIVLLPSIAKALVLSGSILTVFLLPEFSSSNIGKIKDVQDLSVDYSQIETNKDDVQVVVYTKNKIRIIKVQDDGLKLIKDINYADALKGSRRGKYTVIANNQNYDLIDLNNVQKIPLFPISNVAKNTSLEPNIIPCGKNEYLLSCGSAARNEPSMGMIINNSGDVSRGTIAWPSYPSSLGVDYPYSIGIFGDKIIINSILDQSLTQEFGIHNDNLNIYNVNHQFEKPYPELMDMISLKPLVGNGIGESNPAITAPSSVFSSTVIYGGSTVYLLTSTPRVIRLINLKLTNDAIDYINDEIQTIDASSEMGKVELKFSKLLLGIVCLSTINLDQGFDLWTDGGNLDPRILLYIFNDQIYGEVYLSNGIIEKLIELKQKEHILIDLGEFYKLLLNNWLSRTKIDTFEEVDNIDIRKSLEIAIIKQYLGNKELIQIITSGYIKLMISEVCTVLEENGDYYALFKLYEYIDDFRNVLATGFKLIDGIYQDKQYQTKIDHLPFLLGNYLIQNWSAEEVFWDYSLKLIDKIPSIGMKIFKSGNVHSQIDQIRLITDLGVSSRFESRIEYLEYLVFQQNELKYLNDLILDYLQMLSTGLEGNENLRRQFNELISGYQQQTDLPKLNWIKYLELERHRFLDKHLIELYLKIYDGIFRIDPKVFTLTRQEHNVCVLDEIMTLVNGDYTKELRYLMAVVYYQRAQYDSVVAELCSHTDYQACETFAIEAELPMTQRSEFNVRIETLRDLSFLPEESNNLLLKIFDMYLDLDNDELIERFLFRYNSKLDVLHILDKIPSRYSIQFIYNILIKSLINLNISHSNSVLKKNLTRLESRKYKKLVSDFGELIEVVSDDESGEEEELQDMTVEDDDSAKTKNGEVNGDGGNEHA